MLTIQIIKSDNKIEVTNGNNKYNPRALADILFQSEKIKALDNGRYHVKTSIINKDGKSLFKIEEVEKN